ncbi:hypothetical protein D9M68_955890 [compost metagenome]
MPHQPVRVKISIRLSSDWPMIETSIRTRMICGNDMKISETRMASPSSHPPT